MGKKVKRLPDESIGYQQSCIQKFFLAERSFFDKTHTRVISALVLFCCSALTFLFMSVVPWKPSSGIDIFFVVALSFFLGCSPFVLAVFILTKFLKDGIIKKLLRGFYSIIWVFAGLTTVIVFVLAITGVIKI